jgi:hypothetical protein
MVVSGQLHALAAPPPDSYPRIQGLCPRAGLDVLLERKVSCPVGIRTPDLSDLNLVTVQTKLNRFLNPLNAELSPIYHLLALLRAHPILHVSRIRVNHNFLHCTQIRKRVREFGSAAHFALLPFFGEIVWVQFLNEGGNETLCRNVGSRSTCALKQPRNVKNSVHEHA